MSRRGLRVHATAALLVLAATAGCNRSTAPTLVRLVDRLHPTGTEIEIPIAATIGNEPMVMPFDRDAAEIGTLRLRLAGSAKSAGLNWKRAGEQYWTGGRRLDFPLTSDGTEQTYDIDISREPQWIGRIQALRLSATAGSARLVSIRLLPLAQPYRAISLHGITLPSPVTRPRIEIPFDGDLPKRARFEAYVGLAPEFERQGATGCFELALLAGGEERSLWKTCISSGTGSASGSSGWQAVACDVELPRRGTLVLATTAKGGGAELTHGAARWGNPVLVAADPTAHKNLVLIVIDTLRADELGAYGNAKGLTPNLDRFAAGAARLAELRSPAPWTLPSMATLMTGLQPQTHGAGRRLGNDAPMGLPDGFTTLAETLSANGYYTSGVYKNIYVNPEFGLHRGFDRYASHDEMPTAGAQGPPVESNAGFLVDRALAELARIRDRKFFLYVHLFDPHNPYEAPAEWCERVARRELPAYAGALGCRVDRRPEDPPPSAADFGWIRALYDTEVAYTDHELGRLFEALADSSLASNTVVAVVSDHGEEFYERLAREQELRYDANSDHGHTLYEELLRVPGMIRVPGVAPRVVEDPVQTADLYPTLLAALGVANPLAGAPDADGQDLSAALAGTARPQPVPFIADVILHGPPRVAVRRGPWKLISSPRPALASELYDLEHDPGEATDVAAAHPDVVAGLMGLLRQAQQDRQRLRRQLVGNSTLRATAVEWSHVAKLRALGYLH